MNPDARISTALADHHKTKKLHKRLGGAGCWALVCLFLYTARNKPSGDLSGMTDEDIELAANWVGDDGALVEALTQVRFLDGGPGERFVHDWAEHNPWAASADARSAAASAAAGVGSEQRVKGRAGQDDHIGSANFRRHLSHSLRRSQRRLCWGAPCASDASTPCRWATGWAWGRWVATAGCSRRRA